MATMSMRGIRMKPTESGSGTLVLLDPGVGVGKTVVEGLRRLWSV